MAGGKKIPELDALTMAYNAVQKGAAGVDMGRNIFQSEAPIAMIQAVRAVVHDNETPKKAFDLKNTFERTKMKAAYWYNNKDIRIKKVRTPKPKHKEMLVKVISCGICGSDIVEWYRLPRAPLVQGHEIGAEVFAAGASVKKYKPGDRVFIAPKVPCMKCFYCENGHYPQCSEVKERLPGGFAEYILVPEILIERGTYLLPENITFDQSTFIEPLACVVRAQRLARVKKGQSMLVIGCGMSGLLNVKLAQTKGCKIIAADINKTKLEIAINEWEPIS